MEATPHFGVLLFAILGLVILFAILLLFFLFIARHRMLGLLAVGVLILFMGVPALLYLKFAREAAYQGAAHQEMILRREQQDRLHQLETRKRVASGPMSLLAEDMTSWESESTPMQRTTVVWPAKTSVAEIEPSNDLDLLQTAAVEADAVEVDLASSPNPEPAAVPVNSVARPTWVQDAPSIIDGQPAAVLVSDPFETGDECDDDIRRRLREAIQSFARQHGQQRGVPQALSVPVRPEDLQLVSRDRFVDVIPTSVGPMKQVHQLVVFDDDFQRVVQRRVSEAVVGQRLVRTGVFSGGVLLLVGSLFGILKGAARRSTRATA